MVLNSGVPRNFVRGGGVLIPPPPLGTSLVLKMVRFLVEASKMFVQECKNTGLFVFYKECTSGFMFLK